MTDYADVKYILHVYLYMKYYTVYLPTIWMMQKIIEKWLYVLDMAVCNHFGDCPNQFLNWLLLFSAAKPIDLLAKYISAEDEDIDIEMHEPYTYLNVSMFENYPYTAGNVSA